LKKVYIAGPYRGKSYEEVEQNIRTAEIHARFLWSRGFACFTPHLNTAHFDGLCPDAAFLEGTMEFLRSCDYIYLLPGYEKSEGSRAELAEAQRLGIPVLEIDDGK
jgi:hypothetical protein